MVYKVFKTFRIPKTMNIVVAPKFSTSAGPSRLVIITNVNSDPYAFPIVLGKAVSCICMKQIGPRDC